MNQMIEVTGMVSKSQLQLITITLKDFHQDPSSQEPNIKKKEVILHPGFTNKPDISIKDEATDPEIQSSHCPEELLCQSFRFRICWNIKPVDKDNSKCVLSLSV